MTTTAGMRADIELCGPPADRPLNSADMDTAGSVNGWNPRPKAFLVYPQALEQPPNHIHIAC